MEPEGAVRLLHGFSVVVFVITATLGVYAFLLTEVHPGASWKARAIWAFGGVVVATACGWVAIGLLLALSRMVGL